jgi:Ankyrin repeats (3 copies)
MKKGCLLWLLQLVVFTGLYYLAIRGRVTPRAEWLGALGGGVSLLLVIGAFRNVWSARKSRALLDHALTGAPFEDGQRIAAVGPVMALGAPIHAPFSEIPCVFYSWEIAHVHPGRSQSRPQRIKDFSGFALTPCVVQTPTGNVRILGFPVLEGFAEVSERGDLAYKRARAYLSSVSFEKVGVTNAFSQLKDLLTDEDGHLRKDWQMAGDDFQLDSKVHSLWEQMVKDGETVCALGVYSAERRGIVPKGEGIKLVRGDSEKARKTLGGDGWKYGFMATVLFIVTHFLLVHFVSVRSPQIRAERAAGRQAELFQAVKDGDLATVTAQLDAGFDPNMRGEYGNTPLMVVEDPRVARRRISAGADVNARNEDAATPLIEAAKYGHLEVVRLLLQSGADVHARDLSEERNALDWALVWDPADEDYEEVVTVLRDAGARERSP